MENPQFTHDCDECTFLGRDNDTNTDTPVDMYFCEQKGLPTIIMRYGNKGSEYTSAPIKLINESSVFDNSPMLRNMLIAEDRLLWQRNR